MVQVLLDALVHGFLRMEQVALMVFDEGGHGEQATTDIHWLMKR